MPEPPCSYGLEDVIDRGQQQGQSVPGLSSVASTYRFDATVTPDPPRSPRTRYLGIIAGAEMGDREPFSLVT